ncbi:MAG TPA: Fis family transcriptional regulator [Hydrogenophaga sp.]|uniref:sigma-54 interaction domain-containing protein n=1 Tax=Hydrogenophaga sp. TaxID=1904254 RepID=UPI0008BD8578|nr:sigma-54-dependent Fis family transcriptional regulator [Hydrogenophaga sp.]OGA74320.1 MAG: Fis family transcriptional regulator [Burkholderiales bacterium GWE1_65_30]OGA89673.1 MAG: Fis family transcriptional regulator [Burkholderiales bacterium GWF1_66_17]HAX22682.1 Fis family transcriptional regulator [Hydrogenophaga sp.]HBU18223.1 Fis family transcriptional regulator [Hydrogenophaga sp.]
MAASAVTPGDRLKPLPELTAFLEGLPEPHILFDAQYRILAANAAYRRQYSPERSVVGRCCYEVSHHFAVPCDQAGESCPLAQSRASGQRERVLHLHHTPQGEEYVNIELSPLPGPDGQPAFYVEKMEPLRVAQGQPSAQGLIGRSEAFQRMLALVARVAPSRATVLLLGESGTGKELVARAVHEASPRAGKPLVAVDCSSLPETLFESELFGHERGAFTGASTAKGGLVEAASGGTLFLDEVGDIPLPMQVKLLRLLETGTYRRVGSTDLRHADIRVVSATHRDLERLVAEGRFREDLYYRLCTFPIQLPSLRERTGDVALLAPALLQRVAAPRRLQLSPAALAVLEAQDFPGNVRELRNLLERTALLCDGERIEAEHVREAIATGRRPALRPAAPPGLPALTDGPGGAPDGRPADLKTLERAALREMVERHTGSRSDLAERLGISERSLYRKLKTLT